jgi:K+-sensing histidine kinase KdpD
MEPKRLSLNRLIEQPLLLQVNFEDTGRGIPEENIAKLFEPFFHHQEKRQGCRSGSIRGSFFTTYCKESMVSAQPSTKKSAGQIEKETFGARFQNLPLLGFALGIRAGKM